MAMERDIVLTKAQRINIAHLRKVQSLSDQTQTRLTTGRKVNSVVDDPMAYFVAKGLTDRSQDFMERKSMIGQAISTIEASLTAVSAIEDLLEQMKGLAEATKSQSTVERQSATEQFNQIGTQISQLIEDAEYHGTNLLSDVNNELLVRFSERTSSSITIGGFDLNATNVSATGQLFSMAAFAGDSENNIFVGLSVLMSDPSITSFTALGAHNSALDLTDTVLNHLNNALDRLRGIATEMGSNVSLLQTRADFTQAYEDTLSTGSDKLTLADMNEEGANLVALQTRQELGIHALAVSGDQLSSILVLLQ